MYSQATRTHAGSLVHRDAPPAWAVLTVKSCVVGLLTLPLVMPLLLAATTAVGPAADMPRKIAFGVSIAVWVGLFVCAQVLTTIYPPVRSR